MEEKKSIYDGSEIVVWGGRINEFLWLCSGVNRKILRQCPTEYAKYAGMGGTIFFTACMAALSGGYAISTVFDNSIVAVIFGIFWGMLIFNLDRLIVNTMYSDGKVTISWQELVSGLPRIVMAIFLGIVISTPLELKIFEDAIDIQIEQDKDRLLNEKIGETIHRRDSTSQKRDEILNGVAMFDTQITTSSTETNNLLSDINDLQTKLNAENNMIRSYDQKIVPLQRQLNSMTSDNSQYQSILSKLGSLRSKRASAVSQRNALAAAIRGKQGQVAASDATLKTLMGNKQAETQKESERLHQEIDSLNLIINESKVRHKDWTEEDIKTKGSFRDKLEVQYKGFQARMKAFSELKEESPATNISSIFIMLLFIIVETAPTFLRMMVADGSYENLLDAEKHKIEVLACKKKSDINDVINTEIQISTEKNRQRLEEEIKANKELMEKIAKTQAELLQIALDKWREEELAKIQENPSAYIKTNNS
ncbi:MAG: DUF4407 domain-containing protein [Prevotella sp.]|nr:DUF4407 domain-containing protein [Prevotella sp.]